MPTTKVQLDPLPPSENKEFWEHADIHTNLIPEPVVKTKIHYFIRKSGREAQCTHCDWGFALDPGDKIVDGHLYDKAGTLVI
jgi:hypothetical protein